MVELNIIIAINLIIFFSLLFFRKKNVLPNKVLALILLNPAINFISNISTLTGHLPDYPYLYFTAQAMGFAFSPLVYIYVLLMTGQRLPRWHPAYLLTAACVIFGLYLGYDFYNLTTQQQAIYLSGVLNGPYPEGMLVLSAFFVGMQQIYFTLAAIQVYRYRNNITATFSNLEQTRFRFITILITLLWALNLAAIVMYGLLPTTDVEYVYLPLIVTIIYSLILYFSFHYNSVFTTVSYSVLQEVNTNVEQTTKFNSPNVLEVQDASGLQEVLELLEESLKQNELFLDPNLTLSSLASNLKIPVKKLSLSINKLLDKNFYDYINGKRIDKSILLLKERSNYTIEAIAIESGFNSRSAFYRAFKKVTGKTPAEYLEK
ncbi:helix-turn-helix domain-containing protein [Pedobacter arcticus]|uniref:helix-turn-helix domain-containing protein n=1 Tax=Pedobacter arcticus TaxID=752140 RepID=UPI00030DB8EC|nr:helix-turn-helix domain-containing protein [Pedobacter arcticus]